VNTIGPGHRGERVRDVQSRLSALGFHVEARELGGHAFGDSTDAAVRTFQQERGLLVDGLVGAATWQELVEAGYSLGDRILYLRHPHPRGDDVRALQGRLNLLGFDPGREDGIFGDQTAQAVRDFQLNVGLRPDGIVGPSTTDALDRLLAAPTSGFGRAGIRETEGMREGAGSLDGRTIAIDPGHGPGDPGGTGPTGSTEAEEAYGLALGLAEELARRGSRTVILRQLEDDPGDSERAARANQADADVLLSIHLNGHPDPAAEGSAAYYF
jgi:N-acetylmuramoyl-L-alanine amidase